VLVNSSEELKAIEQMKWIWLSSHSVRSLIIIALFLHRGPCYSAQPTILGVLEDVPPVYAGDVDKPAVRVLFRFDNSRWIAYPSDCSNQDCLRTVVSKYPTTSRWLITFQGRELTQLIGRTPLDFKFYSEVGLQEVQQSSTIPWVGKRSEDYGGFIGTAVYRPLVAVTMPYFVDPDGWKESPVPSAIQTILRKAFRRLNPKLCWGNQSNEQAATPFHFRNDQVAVARAYKSRSGFWLARLHLDDACACDEVVEIDDPWFIVRPDKSVKYLDAGIWLVDTGDYDNDGKSELLFSIDGYNRGGYELFYDDFAKHSTFEYSFH
jgi:hypothetical protein